MAPSPRSEAPYADEPRQSESNAASTPCRSSSANASTAHTNAPKPRLRLRTRSYSSRRSCSTRPHTLEGIGRATALVGDQSRDGAAPADGADALAAPDGSTDAILFRPDQGCSRGGRVRVGLDLLMRDAPGSETLKELVDPATARVIRPAPACSAFGSMNGVACSSMSHSTSSPTRRSWDRPKNRVYQSTPTSRADTGTPATSLVITLISWRCWRGRRRTGLISTTGVPSIASSVPTMRRPPSTARTVTRCRPIGLTVDDRCRRRRRAADRRRLADAPRERRGWLRAARSGRSTPDLLDPVETSMDCRYDLDRGVGRSLVPLARCIRPVDEL